MTPEPAPRQPLPGSQKVAVITGASQGIGAGLVAAYRRAGYAVVATARSMPSSDASDFLTVRGDIADVAVGVVLALAVTAAVSRTNVSSWWIMPAAVAVLLPMTVWRATRRRSRT
jgi:NAD(P)-dependent dehydrogenase (short-subunit alcohol dehydrogenase family)